MAARIRIDLCFLVAISLLCFSCGGGGSQPTQPTQPSQPPSINVATGSHVLGNADAKVTIIEFADYQCPYCRNFFTDTEPQIISTYVNTGKARIAFRQFPLGMHVNAMVAAEASECAAAVGGNDAFWKYHDVLFTNSHGDGTGLDSASLKQYAANLHLDTTNFNKCLDNHEAAADMNNDLRDGAAAGVNCTPTFFVNGRQLSGAQPFSAFQQAIDAELQK